MFGNSTSDDLKQLDEATFLDVFDGVPQAEISKKPEIIEPIVSKKKNDAQSKKDQWKEFVNLSETNVKLVDNIEGQKVYHSTI